MNPTECGSDLTGSSSKAAVFLTNLPLAPPLPPLATLSSGSSYVRTVGELTSAIGDLSVSDVIVVGEILLDRQIKLIMSTARSGLTLRGLPGSGAALNGQDSVLYAHGHEPSEVTRATVLTRVRIVLSRVIYCKGDGDMTLSNIEIRHGNGGYGGGISMNERCRMTITDCSFALNRGTRGGAIFMQDDTVATVTSSSFHMNYASRTGSGAAVHERASLTVINSRFTWGWSGWSGGGIHVFGSGQLVLTDVTFDNCKSQSDGGAISAFDTYQIVRCSWSTPSKPCHQPPLRLT